MLRLAAILVSALALAQAAAPDLNPALKAIENRYNHAQSLKLDFSESYAASLKPAQQESGVLYLRKPGRMRWEYSAPSGKVFLADGKNTWLYTPEDHRAEKSSLKLSEDERAPLAFLLGRLDFHKDFQSLELRNEGSQPWIVAKPKSKNLAYSEVDFQAGPDGQIHTIRVLNQDGSKLEFHFSNEQLNVPVAPNLFVFNPPPGVQVVSADQSEAQQ